MPVKTQAEFEKWADALEKRLIVLEEKVEAQEKRIAELGGKGGKTSKLEFFDE